MKQSYKTTARDFFLYLLVIGLLYVSVWSFISLLFEYINELFPDVLRYTEGANVYDIRNSIAILLVVFPVYIGVTWFLRKDIIAHPEKRDFGFRKLFLYLTLFVAAVTIIVDLVTLVNNFLQGDLSVHFFLKVLVVFIVAGAVFGYYFWDLRRETTSTSKPSKILAIIAVLVVGVSIITGFFIIDFPFTQRQRRLDERRVNDLQTIQYQVIHYWKAYEQLPRSLQHLEENTPGVLLPKDPETKSAYEYKSTGPLTFELCATFSLASNEKSQVRSHGPYPAEQYGYTWQHEKGRTCFPYTIDPKRERPDEYPTVKPIR